MKAVLFCLLLVGIGTSHGSAQGSDWDSTAPRCQILDKAPEPAYSLGLTYIEESQFDGFGKSRMAELDGAWELAYYRDILSGDIDLGLDFDGMLFFSSAELQLPDQLVVLAADVDWTWRYVNGAAIQVRAAPGIYSDIEELAFRSFAFPFSAAGVMTFSSELSATVGLQVRPGFDQLVMPIIGAVWGPADWIRIEATLPEARLSVRWNDEWSSYLAWAWENTTYSIREKGDYDRKKITLEGYRTSLGVARSLSDSLHFVGEIGMLSDRSIVFERTPGLMPEDIDVESGAIARFGVGGAF